MIGGVALLIAAGGAVTAGQAMSASEDTSPAASRPTGGYVAKASTTSLESREATVVSRSGERPGLPQNPALENAAEQQAIARDDSLRNAANNAESYAQELESDEWVLPTPSYSISVWFGEAGAYWSSGYHTGIDLAAPYGQPVVAVTNAVVAETGYDGSYGNYVNLQLENGDQVTYNHLSSTEVVAGETVTKGQQLGRVGDTGNAFGYHLHFEYRLASDLEHGVDPVPYLAQHDLIL